MKDPKQGGESVWHQDYGYVKRKQHARIQKVLWEGVQLYSDIVYFLVDEGERAPLLDQHCMLAWQLLWIFRGCWPVLLRNPIFLWFFREGLSSCPHPLDPRMNKALANFIRCWCCFYPVENVKRFIKRDYIATLNRSCKWPTTHFCACLESKHPSYKTLIPCKTQGLFETLKIMPFRMIGRSCTQEVRVNVPSFKKSHTFYCDIKYFSDILYPFIF